MQESSCNGEQNPNTRIYKFRVANRIVNWDFIYDFLF